MRSHLQTWLFYIFAMHRESHKQHLCVAIDHQLLANQVLVELWADFSSCVITHFLKNSNDVRKAGCLKSTCDMYCLTYELWRRVFSC